jgi:PhnB protein
MQATPYLFFNGNCAEALEFYGKAIGAQVESSMTYGTSPAASHMPQDMHDKIIHAMFRIGDTQVMASDCPPEQWGGAPTGFALSIKADSAAEAEAAFAGLADGGKVSMAIGPTFFAERFGQVTDKFGILWMVIFEKPHG